MASDIEKLTESFEDLAAVGMALVKALGKEGPAPQVNIEPARIDIQVPKGERPLVNVEPAIVQLEPKIEVQAAQMIPPPEVNVTVERDDAPRERVAYTVEVTERVRGNISKLTITPQGP